MPAGTAAPPERITRASPARTSTSPGTTSAEHLQRHGQTLLAVVLLACAPYIVLKLPWLVRRKPVVRDPELVDTAVYRVANALTLLLDIVLVLVVVRSTGLRATWPARESCAAGGVPFACPKEGTKGSLRGYSGVVGVW